MRYAGLTKLGKKAFCVNFTLLDKLKITTKEAILLQQIEFVNKKSDFLVLPLTILSTITNMSRAHLYRCLNKLKNTGLIVVTDEGIAITDYYKEIRQQDFLQNHSKNKALQQKMAKKSQNVACFEGYRVANLQQEVMFDLAKHHKEKCQHHNKGHNDSKIPIHDQFYYTQYRCDDIQTIQNANDARCLAWPQHDKAEGHDKEGKHDNKGGYQNAWQYDKHGQQDKTHIQYDKIDIQHNKERQYHISKALDSRHVLGSDQNADSIYAIQNNEKVLHSQNITQKSNIRKNAKNVACDENNKATNTQENKALNSQNSGSFFVTNLSQNVTNLSQNETPIYNKEYNNISLCDTSHKEYIYSLPKEAANKKQRLRDSLALLLDDLKKYSSNKDNFKIPSDIYNELAEEFQKRVIAQSKIKPNVFFSKLSESTQEKVRNFMLSLNTSLLFLNIEAKKAFFADLEALANSDMLEKAIEYSSNNKLLWICLDNDDGKGKKYLRALYVDMQKELDKKIKTLRLEYVKSMSKEQILHEVISQYGRKIDEFIAYREARNRYFNKHAFHALLHTLSGYFMQGQDIGAMLEQSVCRGYNWVFPLTHNSGKRRCA